jgi:ankyrin repeat protein
VQQGADKDKADEEGCTPLFMAAQQGHLAVAQYLVQQGVDKDKAWDNGATPFFKAAQNGHLGWYSIWGNKGLIGTRLTILAFLHSQSRLFAVTWRLSSIWYSKGLISTKPQQAAA